MEREAEDGAETIGSMARDRPIKRTLTREYMLEKIGECVDQELATGRRRELVFIVSTNEQRQIEKVEFDKRIRIA